MAGGLGRRGQVKSHNIRLEEDELFKEIGGQLEDANFDYSQWQRTKTQKGGVHPPGKAGDGPQPEDRPVTGFTVSSGGERFAVKRVVSADGCKHGRSRDQGQTLGRKERALHEAAEMRKAEQMRIIQLRLRARRQTIKEYRERKTHLLQDNMKLRSVIENQESTAHHEVKKLLRKYEQFRGGIATLNDRFITDLSDAKQSLHSTRLKVEIDLTALQREVNEMDGRLKEKQLELHILTNYKDKEYPVKNLRISELAKEIDNLRVTHQDDETELQHIVETEIEKFRSEQTRIKRNITEDVTENALSKMHPSLKDMALQNMVMKKEKEFHEKEVEELKEQNELLEAEVKQLLKSPASNIRQQMFPEFFPTQDKCTPDMDVVLDIPTQQWLPI